MRNCQVHVASTRDDTMTCRQWLDELRSQSNLQERTGGVFVSDLPQRYSCKYRPMSAHVGTLFPLA